LGAPGQADAAQDHAIQLAFHHIIHIGAIMHQIKPVHGGFFGDKKIIAPHQTFGLQLAPSGH